MRGKRIRLIISIAALLIFSQSAPPLKANDAINDPEIERILRSFKNYRFSNVSLYAYDEISMPFEQLKKAVESFSNTRKGGATAVTDETVKNACTSLSASAGRDICLEIESAIKGGQSCQQVFNSFSQQGIALNQNEFETACSFYDEQINKRSNEVVMRHAYIVTSRPTKQGDNPSEIYALIVSYNRKDGLEDNLESANAEEIFTKYRLKNIKLDPGEFEGATSFYELIERSLLQGLVTNSTPDMQGIGFYDFTPRSNNMTNTLEIDPATIQTYDLQKYVMLSEGSTYFSENFNQLILSPDLISWKKYKDVSWYHAEYTDENGQVVKYQAYPSNFNLPDIGLEISYGINDINIPSFWSERITASALWQSVKLGIILPTAGYSSIMKDAFDQDRTLTNAGFGIAGELDFPIGLVKNSGVFHISAALNFGDAVIADYKNRPKDPLLIDSSYFIRGADFYDYLIRGNATVHYTFGLAIDQDYWMRFHMGISYYNVEYWFNDIKTDPVTQVQKFKYIEYKDESIVGISGKLEFMSTNTTTPFGLSLSYFDAALGANVWMQIPIVENTFALKLEGNGYFAAFRDNLHNWERNSVFIPMLRFMVYF